MNESILQKKFVMFLNKHKIYHVKIITAGTAGHPDIIACINSKFISFELKSSTGHQSELQKYRQTQIENNGGKYILLTPKNFKEVFP